MHRFIVGRPKARGNSEKAFGLKGYETDKERTRRSRRATARRQREAHKHIYIYTYVHMSV